MREEAALPAPALPSKEAPAVARGEPKPSQPPAPVRAPKPWLRRIVLVALLALAAGGYALWRRPDVWQPWFNLSAPVATIMVSGNIEAHESVVGFKTVQSRIVALPFDEGKSVRAGTVIARVDDSDYRQQVAIAEAALEVQRRQLAAAEQNLAATEATVVSDQADLAMKTLDERRAQTLLHGGAGTTQQHDLAATALRQSQSALQRDQALALVATRNIDLAKANIRSAEAQLEMDRIVLGYTTLVAPFDGVILVREAELGEIAQPGTAVITLGDLDHVWLRAYINETDIARVRLGAKAIVTTDTYPGKTYAGRISFIAADAEFTPKTVETHAERVSLVYRIKIDLDNPSHELVPGMPADAAIGAAAP